jgi:hypothetical protein
VYQRRATFPLEGGEDKIATQVCPGNLVDGEEWEANYHDLKAQLKEQEWDRPQYVESP